MVTAKKKASAKKASKKASAKKVAAGNPKKPDSTTLLMPPDKTIKDLTKDRSDSKKRQQSIAGTIGKAIADAVGNKHLDRKAFGIACQLEAMDDERLHITYFHLLHYLEVNGVVKRATAQSELFEKADMGGEAGEEDEEGDDDAAGTTDGVVNLHETRAARQVAEAAGG